MFLAGAPESEAELPFTDVPSNEWYYDALCWAWENGVARLEIAVCKEDLVARHVFDRHGYGSAGFRRGVAGPDGQTFDELLLEKPVPPREEA